MDKKERMFGLVEKWLESGLDRKVFCELENITVHKFNYWIAKKKKEETDIPGGFTRLQAPTADSGYEITYPSGVKLHVKRTDLATLSRLLRL